MVNLVLSDDDVSDLIKAALSGGDMWASPHVKDLKGKIKDYHRAYQNEQCCYCRKNSHGEFKMVLDIEHILPKKDDRFRPYIFDVRNLSVSCKRCNMLIKKDDTSFVVDFTQILMDPFVSSGYKFIHPNLDCYSDHIKYFSVVVDKEKLIKYFVENGSLKGSFTYDYFRLEELEVQSFNSAQGVGEAEIISGSIPSDLAKKIRDLLGGR